MNRSVFLWGLNFVESEERVLDRKEVWKMQFEIAGGNNVGERSLNNLSQRKRRRKKMIDEQKSEEEISRIY